MLGRPIFGVIALIIAGGTAAAADVIPYLQMPIDLYPPEALAAHLEGEIEATLTAGPDGKVENCSAKGADVLASLKAATCQILTKRINFSPSTSPPRLTILTKWRISKTASSTPMIDADRSYGGAIPISPTYWVFTDDFPTSEIGGPGGSTTATFNIGVDGRATACKIAKSSGSYVLDKQTCSVIEARARFIPAIGEDGKRRASTGYHTLTWRT